jgi:hypothetical protein
VLLPASIPGRKHTTIGATPSAQHHRRNTIGATSSPRRDPSARPVGGTQQRMGITSAKHRRHYRREPARPLVVGSTTAVTAIEPLECKSDVRARLALQHEREQNPNLQES